MTSVEQRWPRNDRIRWVETRRRALVSFRSGELAAWVVVDEDLPLQSMEVWLAKERDGLSWQQIVIKFFPEYRGSRRKSAGVSKARRVYAEVERALEPSEKDRLEKYLDVRIAELFNCSPEQFDQYLESVRLGRRRKNY